MLPLSQEKKIGLLESILSPFHLVPRNKALTLAFAYGKGAGFMQSCLACPHPPVASIPFFSYHSSFLPESYPHDEMSLCFPISGTHRRVNPLSGFRLSVCSSLYWIVWLPVSLHTCTISLTVSALGVPDSVLTPSCATRSGI